MRSSDAFSFDPVLTSRARLAIVAALYPIREADFTDLMETLSLTKGNLSVHAQKLEEARYIEIRKSFEGRKPRTTFRITAEGRRALAEHVRRLEGLMKEDRP
jgi:DNA-binding MarR family transcriptional regulator